MKKPIAVIILAATSFSTAVADDNNKQTSLSYSYIEGAYVHDNFKANGLAINDEDGIGNTSDDNFGNLFDDAGSGGAGRISYALPFGGKSVGFHAVADYLQTSHRSGLSIANRNGVNIANGNVSVKHKEFRMAFGVHTTSSDTYSLFAELGIANNKAALGGATLATADDIISVDLGAASGSKTALDARAGIRGMVTDRLELTGYVRYHGAGKLVSGEDGTVDFDGKVKVGAGAFYRFGERFKVGGDYEFDRPGRLRLVARLSF